MYKLITDHFVWEFRCSLFEMIQYLTESKFT